MDASAVVSLLQSSDGGRVLVGLDGWLRSLLSAHYLISSTLYPTLALILHRTLSAQPPPSSHSSPSSAASVGGAAGAPPLVLLSRAGFELLLPSHPLFELIFTHSAFPPLYSLPLTALTSRAQQRVRAVLAGDEVTSASCPLASLYRSAYSAEADALRLSMVDFLFFHLASFLTAQHPQLLAAAAAAAPGSSAGAHSGRGSSTAAGGGGFGPRLSSALSLPSSSTSPPFSSQPYTLDDVYRCYVQLVQAYLSYFLPLQPSASPSSSPLARLHGLRLAHILAELWMGETVGAVEGGAADEADELGSSARWPGLASQAPFPFLPAAPSLPSAALRSFASSSSSSSLSSFVFPSVYLTGCVRLLVVHLLSLTGLPGGQRGGAGASGGGAVVIEGERGGARPLLSSTSSAAQLSPSVSSSSSPAFSALSVGCVDGLLFRFLRAALLHPTGVYEERMQAMVALWLAVLSSPLQPTPSAAAASAVTARPAVGSAPPPPSPPSIAVVSDLFPFFSPLLLWYLRALLACDIGREGSSVRGQCLSHALQLMRSIDALHPQLAEVEHLLLRGREEVEAATARRATPATAASRSSAANAAAAAATAAKTDFARVSLSTAEASLQPLFTHTLMQGPSSTVSAVSSSASALPPPIQLLVEVLRLTTPSSIRLALSSASSSLSSSSILPPLLPSSSSSSSLSSPLALPRSSSAAFRALLVQEERTWRQMRDLVIHTFHIPPLDDDLVTPSSGDSKASSPLVTPTSSPASRFPSASAGRLVAVGDGGGGGVGRGLSPERVFSDAFHRLSERGRLQLRGGVALCTKHSPAVAFIGDEWDAPASSHESHLALQLLRSAHSRLRGWRKRARPGQQARVAAERGLSSASGSAAAWWLVEQLLERAPLRLLARWDVLACLASAIVVGGLSAGVAAALQSSTG